MASRPVDRGFGRRGETKVPFHPVKSGFGRMAEPKMLFHPVKGGFGRMGMLWAGAQECRKTKTAGNREVSCSLVPKAGLEPARF